MTEIEEQEEQAQRVEPAGDTTVRYYATVRNGKTKKRLTFPVTGATAEERDRLALQKVTDWFKVLRLTDEAERDVPCGVPEIVCSLLQSATATGTEEVTA